MARPKTAPAAEIDDDDDDDEAGETGATRQRRKTQLEIKGLPDGVRAYFKKRSFVGKQEYWAYIYRKKDVAGKPGKVGVSFITKIYNTEIDEEYLQLNFGAGRYRVMYQVPEEGGHVQIECDEFDVSPPPTSPATVAPGAVGAPVGLVPAGDRAGGLRQSISDLRELAEVLVMLRGDAGGIMPATSSPILQQLERRRAEQLIALEDMEEKLRKKLATPVIISEKKPEAAWPEFIAPFVPELKKFGMSTLQELATNLLGDGTVSKFIKQAVISNPQFQAMWADEQKRDAAFRALVEHLGDAGGQLIRLFTDEMAARR